MPSLSIAYLDRILLAVLRIKLSLLVSDNTVDTGCFERLNKLRIVNINIDAAGFKRRYILCYNSGESGNLIGYICHRIVDADALGLAL